MLTDAYGQSVPYLDYSDAPDLSAWGADLVGALTPQTVMRFASKSARDATLVGSQVPVVGMLAYSIAEDELDVYQAGGWTPLTPGPWEAIPWASGYEEHSGTPGYRIVGQMVQLRGTVQKTSGSFPTNTLTTIAQMPAGLTPTTFRYGLATTQISGGMFAQLSITDAGAVQIYVPAGNTAAWLSLDSFSYSLT